MNHQPVSTISVHDLKKEYDNCPDLRLIDVRELDEWEALRIPGAIHIPKDLLPTVIDVKVPDRSCPVYLHCRGGVRSLDAAEALINLALGLVFQRSTALI